MLDFLFNNCNGINFVNGIYVNDYGEYYPNQDRASIIYQIQQNISQRGLDDVSKELWKDIRVIDGKIKDLCIKKAELRTKLATYLEKNYG